MTHAVRLVWVLAMCLGATRPAIAQQGTTAGMTPAEKAKADHGIPPYTPADVHFMQGMIGHHSQAVVMAGWAESHGAGHEVLVMAQRIDVSQRDEIATMQTWLRDRHEMVPDPSAHAMAGMPGMKMDMPLMPGMLTPVQMARLDSARGPMFDRLFLTDMIQHHQGALTMVAALFDARGAGQDDTMFKFASDVQADQTAEIDRMESMLDAIAESSASSTSSH
jgi:uncharacterized protein (DUF305 family)